LTIVTARSEILRASQTNRPVYPASAPHQSDRGERLAQRGGAERTVTVLQGGGRDHDGQQQSAGVDRDVPLAPLIFFPQSYPLVAVGTVSGVEVPPRETITIPAMSRA
jgi:hypothetical protein